MSDSEDSSWDISIQVYRDLSPLIQVPIQPVGKYYHQYEYNKIHGVDSKKVCSSNSGSSERSKSEATIDEDIDFLRSLDPTQWKDQDHYRVLGLQKYRYKATEEDIKKAYRFMVLKHHPDKRQSKGKPSKNGDDYFTNITKAFETLGDPIKRRSFDSVDPSFDDDIPCDKLNDKDRFYEVFAPVFDLNARWSVNKSVPQLGGPEDSKEKVDNFYDFWYNFESWREFSYLDEEDREKGEDREERRWIDKQNKAERALRRKEENARIRKLVDNAYKLDPRVIKFREEERQRKAAIKRAKQEAARHKEELEIQERLRAEELKIKQKEREEEELRNRLAVEKREREAMKNKLKRERKELKTLCEANNYFISDENDKAQAMFDLGTLCDSLQLERLRELISKINLNIEDKENARKIIKQEVNDLRCGKIENRNIISATATLNGKSKSSSASNALNGSAASKEKVWGPDELQLLIKAVNLFPVGTGKRWEVVSQYLVQHGSSKVSRSPKEVLKKAKELEGMDASAQMREAANKNAAAQLAASVLNRDTGMVGEASQRLETPQEMLGINLAPWTAEEQARLEQALKTYPSNTDDRWGKIAEAIPGRSKKDCMRRYKVMHAEAQAINKMSKKKRKAFFRARRIETIAGKEVMGARKQDFKDNNNNTRTSKKEAKARKQEIRANSENTSSDNGIAGKSVLKANKEGCKATKQNNKGSRPNAVASQQELAARMTFFRPVSG